MTTTIGSVGHSCLAVEPAVVRREVADPADLLVEVAARGEDDAVVGGPDPVAAERGDVDAVVEELPVDEPLAAGRSAERQRDPALARSASDSRSGRRRRGVTGRGVTGVGDLEPRLGSG